MKTITKKEVLQGNYVTRTIKATTVRCICVEIETLCFIEKSFVLNGEYDNVYVGKTIEKKFGEDLANLGLRFVKVAGIELTSKPIAVPMSWFIDNGFEIVED